MAAVKAAAQALLNALERIAEVSSTVLDQVEARIRLLTTALGFHADHGDQSCPVCSVGVLDKAWRHRVTTELAAERMELAAVRAAQHQLAVRREAAHDQIAAPEIPALDSQLDLANLSEAEAAVRVRREAPSSDAELAQHLTSNVTPLVDALTRLRDEAQAHLSERDDGWGQLAQRIAAWVELRRSANEIDRDLRDAKAAHVWLKDNAVKLRNKRLEPLADAARHVWSRLRQESSIDLDEITLSGQRSRAR